MENLWAYTIDEEKTNKGRVRKRQKSSKPEKESYRSYKTWKEKGNWNILKADMQVKRPLYSVKLNKQVNSPKLCDELDQNIY
jgi:hypothetical protein